MSVIDDVKNEVGRRKGLMIKEKKDRIMKIKEKYNNLQMSDKSAEKIILLEVENKILKTAVVLSGAYTFIKIFVPDPIPVLDELLAAGLTRVIASVSEILENKIEDIAKGGNPDFEMSEIINISAIITQLLGKMPPKNTAALGKN